MYSLEKKLTAYLGQPEKQVGDRLYWQCPYCKDSHRDNMQYSRKKNIVWCFADETHAPQILRDMAASKKNEKEHVKAYNNDYIMQKNYLEIAEAYNKALLKNKELLTRIHNARGLTKETIKAVKLGFDEVSKYLTIPNFQYSTQGEEIVFSFEYRPIDFNKYGLSREKNTPSGLAMINQYTPETEALVMVEGFLDGYVLWQYLNECGQVEYYHIVTPSNGVTVACKQAEQIEFDKYKVFYLYLDNDEAGNKATQKICEKFKLFKPIGTNCNCKDFNEHYLQCIKG